MKPYPRGIYLLTGGQLGPDHGVGDPAPLSNANCDGMRVKTQWSLVQSAAGAPIDFNRIDEAIRIAAVQGRKIGISINAGAFCPQWLYDLGCQSYTLTEGRVAGETIPLPGDPIFLSHWKPVIQAFGARYDSNPFVAYVVIGGIGNHDEWNLCQGPNDSLALEANAGATKWITQAEAIITKYARAFPHTTIMGALRPPFYGDVGKSELIQVVNWAVAKYSGHFGVSCNGLNPNSGVGYLPNQLVNDNAPKQPSGFQEGASLPNGTDLFDSLQAATALRGRYVEVYQPDLANTALQDQITSGRQLLLGVLC